ncbi:MAG TPA: transglycosylase SLT domain-containing protein [Hyphomicrobiales bacterium]|nr:transglycosylase SLT domain-containing protein [Hyphomicrobiales bacterium]
MRSLAAATIAAAALTATVADAALEPVFYARPIGPGAPRASRLMSAEAAALQALARAWRLRTEIFARRQVDFASLFAHFPKAVAARRAILKDAGASDDELVAFDRIQVPRSIVETILQACAITGADPVYLMALADKESSFAPDVKAKRSSAEGLFQFIDSTWLKAIKAYGPKYGLVAEAAAISFAGGEAGVADAGMRRSILDLRRDPYLSALMAGELARRNGAMLAEVIGRQPTEAEAYLAHFFGIDHAEAFVALLQDKPQKAASREFPAAAHANRTLFFARAGRRSKSLSVTQVFDKIDAMMAKRVSRYQDVEDHALGFAEPGM